MSRSSRLLISAMALLGCNGPFGLMPGGALSGEPVPAPSRWELPRPHGTAQIETRPADPYSVNLVYTILDGVLYVNAGDSETRWVANIQADPRVRLRIDGKVYDLRAERVTDPDEIAAFGRAWTAQSMFRRDPAEMDEVYVYRLVPRTIPAGSAGGGPVSGSL